VGNFGDKNNVFSSFFNFSFSIGRGFGEGRATFLGIKQVMVWFMLFHQIVSQLWPYVYCGHNSVVVSSLAIWRYRARSREELYMLEAHQACYHFGVGTSFGASDLTLL